jgi:hypothetical protein
MPPDCKAEVERIFDLGYQLGGLTGGKGDNDIAVFLALVRHARSDWEGAAKVLEEGPE